MKDFKFLYKSTRYTETLAIRCLSTRTPNGCRLLFVMVGLPCVGELLGLRELLLIQRALQLRECVRGGFRILFHTARLNDQEPFCRLREIALQTRASNAHDG